MRILVVDDDRAVRESLRRALELEGHEVDLACDGREAIEHVARGECPDAIVLDVAMPNIDGLEACALIRRHGSDIPILMLSASHERATRAAALDAGANAYLTKPFALEQLLAHVRRLFSAFPMLPSLAESLHSALLH